MALFSSAQSYHAATFSTGLYMDQFDVFSEAKKMRNYKPGINIKMKHWLDYPGFKWLGTNAEINRTDSKTKFNLGLAFRANFYNNFLEVELLAPLLNMNLSGAEKGQYNTPFGFAVHLFTGPLVIDIRELFYKNGLNTRICLSYRINSK